jgi:hypothetical protein
VTGELTTGNESDRTDSDRDRHRPTGSLGSVCASTCVFGGGVHGLLLGGGGGI